MLKTFDNTLNNTVIVSIIIMTKIIKLFLPKDFHEELLYQYEGKEGDLRKLIFGLLTPLGKQGKMVLLNQLLTTRIKPKGVLTVKDFELKDIDLDKTAVTSDPAWIPEKVTKEDIVQYEQSISDRLYQDLVTFGKVYCARLIIYNDSLDKDSKEYKKDLAIIPKCFEQIIQDNVVNALSSTIASNIDKEYNEEFAEMEKKITEKKGPKRNIRKK